MKIPATQTIKMIQEKIVLNAACTKVSCVFKTDGVGWFTYSWAHQVNNQLIRLPGKNTVHHLTVADLQNDLCCVVDGMNEVGVRRKSRIIKIDPPLREQLKPKIVSAKIKPVNELMAKEDRNQNCVIGTEQKIVLDYRGPPKTVIVQWLRETNGDWQHIFEGETYTIQDADCGRQLCAKVIVTTQRSLMGESFTTETLTDACLVAPTDPLLLRFASTMKRAGRGQFEGLLIAGDSLSLSIKLERILIRESIFSFVRMSPIQ
jgi:hypothetical protein